MKFFDKVFGVNVKKIVAELKEKPLEYGQYQYMGGHKMFPQPTWTLIYFYEDRFVLQYHDITVRYDKIKDISNSTEWKREGEHFFVAGIIGYALWKKNHVYTLIEYEDENDMQKIIMDFFNNANYVQGLIYKKILECRKKSEQK